MKIKALTVFGALLISHLLSAQPNCEACDPKVPSDYCYKNDLFREHCAMFKDGDATFKLKIGKKTKTLPLENIDDAQYLVNIAGNKKLKIAALDILFIQSALKAWQVESRNIGYEEQESGLGIKILNEGTGELPEVGQQVTVHYTGWLVDGTKFDSSVDRGRPFKFTLGQGRVIKGWDEGVAKLKKGTKALLKIPSNLGYGSRGSGRTIPPNSTLIFEIELL